MMNKSVLVLDTPINCKECPVSKCSSWVDDETRPADCKLRPLPLKEQCNIYGFEGYVNGRAAGYNKCLSDITGEPEPVSVLNNEMC